MRYSLEPKHRKYVQGYSFLSFNRRFGDKYGKKLMDTATKTEIDAAKTASKRVVQKNAEATADLIGNKIADKITSVGKLKNEKNEKKKIIAKNTQRHLVLYGVITEMSLTILLLTLLPNLLLLIIMQIL